MDTLFQDAVLTRAGVRPAGHTGVARASPGATRASLGATRYDSRRSAGDGLRRAGVSPVGHTGGRPGARVGVARPVLAIPLEIRRRLFRDITDSIAEQLDARGVTDEDIERDLAASKYIVWKRVSIPRHPERL